MILRVVQYRSGRPTALAQTLSATNATANHCQSRAEPPSHVTWTSRYHPLLLACKIQMPNLQWIIVSSPFLSMTTTLVYAAMHREIMLPPSGPTAGRRGTFSNTQRYKDQSRSLCLRCFLYANILLAFLYSFWIEHPSSSNASPRLIRLLDEQSFAHLYPR